MRTPGVAAIIVSSLGFIVASLALEVASRAILGAWSKAVAQEATADPAPQTRVALTYEIIEGERTPLLAGAQPGDPARGREVILSPALGGCLRCHQIAALSSGAPEAPGPVLDGLSDRRNAAQIRLWIVNPAAVSAQSGKPAYYSLEPQPGDNGPRTSPLLTAQQIEDVVAYLVAETSAQ